MRVPPTRVVRASFAAFDGIDAPDKVPTEITLLRAGKNEYAAGNDDAELLFDEPAAKSVMARWQKRGLKLKADYEHQSLANPPVIAPASAKRWTPVVRDGELLATDIQWTKKARQMIADGEYDYFSIAARIEEKTSRVLEIINFALTNTPAANGIAPLIAASASQIERTETRMNTVLVALGLRAEAEEADALQAVTSLKEFEREVVALSGKPDHAGALGALRAMQQSHEQLVALTAKVKQLETDKRGQEFDALLKRGQDAGQISPALAASEWVKQLRAKDDGVVQLTAFLESAPKLVTPGVTSTVKEPAPADAQSVVALTADEKRIARKMNVPLEALAKNKARRMAMALSPAPADEDDDEVTA